MRASEQGCGAWDSGQIRGDVDTLGWTVRTSKGASTDELEEQVTTLAQTLGEIAPGRAQALIERVLPQNTDAAFPGSLSSRYGLGPLPLHTDTAHWSVPCRYLVIACAEPGPIPTPTLLLDTRRAELSEREVAACRDAVFLIRNGRNSFYGSVAQRGRDFLRVDPGCMAATSGECEIALRSFSADRHRAVIYSHQWTVGEILILDNWRVLHARGNKQPTAPGRVLLRAMVR